MSFPRAKIKRFNDIQDATPSPAAYNVDIKQKAKLAVIPQQERFSDCKSPPLSETGSTQSTPCFRTPTMIKRRVALGSTSKMMQSLKLSHKELLNEKSVECENKDRFIKEMTEQLEELKKQLFKVQLDKDSVSREKEKFESEISEWKLTHSMEIELLYQKHESEISDLNINISKLQSDLEHLKSQNALFIEEKEKFDEIRQQEISAYKKEINEKNKIIEEKQKILETMQEDKRNIEEKHKHDVRAMQDKHLQELQSIEIKMLNNMHEMQMALDEQKVQSQLKMKELESIYQGEIDNLKHSSIKEKELINNENLVCMSQLEEKMNEIRLISEIQAAEKCSELENYWKKKLENKEKESNEILKECQAISEYNIIQSEIEKNKYKSKFEEFSTKYTILEKKYDDVYLKYRKLQSSYSNAQNKLYRLLKEMREKESLKSQLDQMIIEKQTYQLSIERCQQTIDILTNRLKESDQDVEQLKREIFNNEEKLLEYEHKFNMMSDELREFLTLNETLEMTNETNLKTTQEEIADLKMDLLAKVEDIKFISDKKIKCFEEELEILKDERKGHLEMLEKLQALSHESKNLLHDAENSIDQLTSENLVCNDQIKKLEEEKMELQCRIEHLNERESSWIIEKKELDFKIDILKNELKQMRIREEEWQRASTEAKEIQMDYESYKKEQECLVNRFETKISSSIERNNMLEEQNRSNLKIIEEQNSLIAPFKDQLESYELEMDNLKCAKDHIESEAKDLGIKYAEILGHQNHKQKIKYMINLKLKNEELSKANINLESELRIQEKKLEKLKKENADLKRTTKKIVKYEDKENIGSPNRSFKCSSPGPLKNVN